MNPPTCADMPTLELSSSFSRRTIAKEVSVITEKLIDQKQNYLNKVNNVCM